MITHFLRVILGRKLRPYSFVRRADYLPDLRTPSLGLYVHIPFCKTLCSFCPYYKVEFEQDKATEFLGSLCSEIGLAAERMCASGKRREVTSLYFGGGSPALMIDDLGKIRNRIDRHFEVKGHCGIELHPRDVNEDTADKLRDSGFDMVSLGVQSFSREIQKNLGRVCHDGEKPLGILGTAGFKAIDVDLIFAIPGQTAGNIGDDFRRAAFLGATQISTYPFIDFSYAKNKNRPLDHAQKRRMLDTLITTAGRAGFERTSVWTFGRKDAPRYSSITRDNFLGFGPSATSLGMDAFKVNTFSVDSYMHSIREGVIPTALRMQFSPRTRRLYWLFWNCYKGVLSESVYRELFQSELARDFGFSLWAGTRLGLLEPAPDGWAMTSKGSYHYHRVEQIYTRQYIDKTWRASMETPWPERIDLY